MCSPRDHINANDCAPSHCFLLLQTLAVPAIVALAMHYVKWLQSSNRRPSLPPLMSNSNSAPAKYYSYSHASNGLRSFARVRRCWIGAVLFMLAVTLPSPAFSQTTSVSAGIQFTCAVMTSRGVRYRTPLLVMTAHVNWIPALTLVVWEKAGLGRVTASMKRTAPIQQRRTRAKDLRPFEAWE